MLLWALIAGWYLENRNPPRHSWRRWIAESVLAFEGWNFRVAFSALNLGLGSCSPSVSEED